MDADVPYAQCQTPLEEYLWRQHRHALHRIAELEKAAAAQNAWLEQLKTTVSSAVRDALSGPEGPLVIETLDGSSPRRRKKLSADEVYDIRVRNAARARLFKNDLSDAARERALEDAQRLDCVPEDFDEDAFLDGELQPADDEDERLPESAERTPSSAPRSGGDRPSPRRSDDVADEQIAGHDCIAMEAGAWLDELPALRVLWFMRRVAALGGGLTEAETELIHGAARLVEYRRHQGERTALRERDRYANSQQIMGFGGDFLFYPNGTPFRRFGVYCFPDGSQMVTLNGINYPGDTRAFGMLGWYTPDGRRTELEPMLAEVLYRFPGDSDAVDDALDGLAVRDADLYRLAIMELAWRYWPRAE